MMRVLLADDDQSTRDVIALALQSDGHELVVCEEGAAAATALDAGDPFDMVITDVEMPGMGGAELANKALSANPDVRVLLISGFSSELDKAHAALAAGKTAKLLKPFTLNDLRDAIASIST